MPELRVFLVNAERFVKVIMGHLEFFSIQVDVTFIEVEDGVVSIEVNGSIVLVDCFSE